MCYYFSFLVFFFSRSLGQTFNTQDGLKMTIFVLVSVNQISNDPNVCQHFSS